MCVGWPVPEFGHLPDVIVRKPEPFNRCSVAGADLDHDVRVHRVDDDRVFLRTTAISRSLLRPSVAVHEVVAPRPCGLPTACWNGVSTVSPSLAERAVTAQSSETLVHEEGVDMPTATGDARIEIDATALTVHNLVSDSNCMVQ
jgi:hypothetical protein